MVNVFIACPECCETGGIELLHQLCWELNQQAGISAKIWYIAKSLHNPQPERYTEAYGRNYIVTETPDSDVVLIFPEIWASKLDRFKNNQRVIFWESVDNYKKWTGRETVPKEYNSFLHLTQSFYASDFLIKGGIDTKQIIYTGDYINPAYLSNMSVTERSDIVLYNPAKGEEFTEQIIARLPDVNFMPICKLTQEQVLKLMDSSKLYIDFGEHPGKDRMPRESASRGCCIITDREGSAKYRDDVNISEEYKFDRDSKNLPAICEKIREVLKHYDTCKADFDGYRQSIKHERQQFHDGVVELAKRLYKPRFSIIIPAFNSENHIRKALESVKMQVFCDFELIIVCDSCTDNTESIAREYTDKVFTVENHCDGPTRNKGIEEAQGDYILFMDDDDWWLHEYVLTQLDEKLKETDADILCFSFIFKHWMYAKPQKPNGGRWIATWNKAWKRECIEESRFSNAHSVSDVQFHEQMFSKKLKVVDWDMPMYYYNFMRVGSQTETDRRK